MSGGAAEELDAALQALGARSVAPGEWGLTCDCAGRPLALGVRAHRRWLSVQGEVCGDGWGRLLDPHWLLHRGRLDLGVRYTHTSSGAVWVQLDVPLAEDLAARVDELLGRVVEAAERARYAASERRAYFA